MTTDQTRPAPLAACPAWCDSDHTPDNELDDITPGLHSGLAREGEGFAVSATATAQDGERVHVDARDGLGVESARALAASILGVVEGLGDAASGATIPACPSWCDPDAVHDEFQPGVSGTHVRGHARYFEGAAPVSVGITCEDRLVWRPDGSGVFSRTPARLVVQCEDEQALTPEQVETVARVLLQAANEFGELTR